jgi:hypothetical protein
MAVNNNTKLAPGTATAAATQSSAPSRLAAAQNPQKPARCASQELAAPAASKAIDEAAMCMGRGCEIHDELPSGGTVPSATARTSSPVHRATPKMSMQSVPTAPHRTARVLVAPLRTNMRASASSRANDRSAAGKV